MLSLDSFVFLLENYWIYLSVAALIGLVTGWLSYDPRATSNERSAGSS